MSDSPRYVPILKGKQGEIDALRSVGLSTLQGMTPLIEVVPPDDPSDVSGMDKALKALPTKLSGRYAHPLQLDAGYFDVGLEMSNGHGPIDILAKAARKEGLEAQPVIRLGYPDLALADAARAHAKDGRGLTIRLDGEDLDEDPEDLDAALDGMLAASQVGRGEADLLLDLGPLEGDVAVLGAGRLLLSLLRDLPSILDWRSVTIAAGAFPVDLGAYTANVIGERLRYDAQVWDYVRKKKLPRDVDFGDYAIAHPALVVGPGFPPPPQLRYLVSDRWLVLKGRRNDPLGNSQFQRICTIIAQHPEFVGAALGAADARIEAGSPEGPGNGTTWRKIGTAHHLDLVVRRLTTLGEP